MVYDWVTRRQASPLLASRCTLLAFLMLLVSWLGLGCTKETNASAKAGAAASAQGTKQGPFSLKVTGPAETQIGKPLVARIELTPQKPYKINLEYPLKLEVKGPAPVQPQQLKMGKNEAKEFGKERVVLLPTFKTDKPGKHQFQGKFKFSVCTEEQCELKQEAITWVAQVTK